MGRFGDWAKGPWKDTVRVAVTYVVEEPGGTSQRFDIITVVPRASLNFHRDAAERVRSKLVRTVRPPKLFRVVSTTVEGHIPFIHPKDSW